MWKKYNCEKLNLKNDSEKLIKKIGGIMRNPVVNFTIYFVMTIMQKLAVTASTATPLLLEYLKLTGKANDKNNVGAIFDIFIAVTRLTDVSITNIIRIDKKIKEINPNSNIIDSLINIKFTGDFDNFERECDKIYEKETSDYAAEQFLVLWLVLSEYLIEQSKKKITPNTFLTGHFHSDIKTVVKKEEDLQIFTHNKSGELILNLKDPNVADLVKDYKNEYLRVINKRRIDDSTINISNDGTSIIPLELRKLLNENVSFSSVIKTRNYELVKIISLLFMFYKVDGITTETALSSNIKGEIKDDRLKGVIDHIVRVCLGKGKDYMFSVFNEDTNNKEWSYFRYGKMTSDEFLKVRLYEENPNINVFVETKIHAETNKRISEANQIITFFTATKTYDLFKFIINNLMPKRMVTLLFDSDSSYSLIDETLSVIAGVILGPKYLAHQVSGETTVDIIQDYLDVEASAPDPFITKYLEENKFIKEKTEEQEKFNIFITSKDYLELERDQYEERLKKDAKKEIITGGIRANRSSHRKKNLEKLRKRYEHTVVRIKGKEGIRVKRGGDVNLEKKTEPEINVEVDEDRVKEKLFILLGQNAKVINEVLNKPEDQNKISNELQTLQNTEIPVKEKIEILNEIKEEKETPKEIDKKLIEHRIAILTGLVSGSALENDIPSPFRDSIYEFLCYLSSNAKSIDKLRTQIFNIFLGFAYFINKINSKIMTIYSDWSKRTGKTSLELFAKEIRQSKQKDLITKLFSKQ